MKKRDILLTVFMLIILFFSLFGITYLIQKKEMISNPEYNN